MRKKRVLTAVLCLLCAALLCACSTAPTANGDPLLKAPRLPGNFYDIQQALDSSVASPYTLKYPTSGEYKSAVTLMDITNDGRQEAVAFYSTTTNDVTSISLCLLTYDGEEWTAVSDSFAYASSIEQIMFDDLDGDNKKEIIVGWVTGPTDKQVCVYSFENATLSQRLAEKYTQFLCCNLNSADLNSLLVVNLDTAATTARATLFGFKDKELATFGSCSLDGGVTAHFTPVLSKLPDGRPAVYIDATKGAGTLTEVLYFDKGALINGAYDPLAAMSADTYRASTANLYDINGDEIPDIPMQVDFLGMAGLSEAEKSYITVWCNHTEKGLVKKQTAYANYTDSYNFELPDGWREGVTLQKDSKKRSRSFYAFNKKKNLAGDALLELITVSKNNFGNGKDYIDSGYVLIAQTEQSVYLAKCFETNSKLKIDIETVKKSFKLIDTGVK